MTTERMAELRKWVEAHIPMSGIDALDLLDEIARLRSEADAGAKFKAFVHSYMDSHGVPHGDPDNEHQKAGCRIGARLDLMFAERDELRERIAALEAGLKPFALYTANELIRLPSSYCRAAAALLAEPKAALLGTATPAEPEPPHAR